uniref:Rad21/Rec8-like protein C-terminal eukaryotic domain-containing protein n=1 Tax=Paramoeba aestuarina TaxID=180227 RepID=A0A7S4PPR1_9EUKA
MFAEELKAGIVVGKPDAPADVSSTLVPPLPDEEEAMLPEFGGNAFSPMQQFGDTGFPEYPMADTDMTSRYEVREQMSGALLDNLKKNASADGNIAFGAMMQAESKKVAAQSFGDLLALISTGEVTVQQRKPFDEILITV